MSDVLIVDDDPDSRIILTTIVATLNLQADSAETVTQALALIYTTARPYRRVLSDLALPGRQDGLDLVRAIRSDARYQDTPCFAITAFDLPHLRTQAMLAGFTDYYVKPLDASLFLRDLTMYLIPNGRNGGE